MQYTRAKKNNLISSFICGWLEALHVMLGFFKGVQTFHPARNLFSFHRNHLLTYGTISTEVMLRHQLKPTETSKKFPLNPESSWWLLGRQRNLPGETARQKCALKDKAHFPPHCGSLFSLELKLPSSSSQILLTHQKIRMLYPSFIFILVQGFISSVSRMTTYTWKTCSCTTIWLLYEVTTSQLRQNSIFFIIIISEPLSNTKAMELLIEMRSNYLTSK